MPDTNTPTAGIDTSKSTLDVAIYGRAEISHVPNTPAACKALAITLAVAGVVRVGIEATGGYERRVVAEVSNPAIARQFGWPVSDSKDVRSRCVRTMT